MDTENDANNTELHWERELGTECRTNPLPILHPAIDTNNRACPSLESWLCVDMDFLSVIATFMRQFFDVAHPLVYLAGGMLPGCCNISYVSALTYLLLQSSTERVGKHVRVPRAELIASF